MDHPDPPVAQLPDPGRHATNVAPNKPLQTNHELPASKRRKKVKAKPATPATPATPTISTLFSNALSSHPDHTLNGLTPLEYALFGKGAIGSFQEPGFLQRAMNVRIDIWNCLQQNDRNLEGALPLYKFLYKEELRNNPVATHPQAKMFLEKHKSGIISLTLLFHMECGIRHNLGADGNHGLTSYFIYKLGQTFLKTCKSFGYISESVDLTPEWLETVQGKEFAASLAFLFTEHKPWCHGFALDAAAPCNANAPCNASGTCNAAAPCNSTGAPCNAGSTTSQGKGSSSLVDPRIYDVLMDITLMLAGAAGFKIVHVHAMGKFAQDYWKSRNVPIKCMFSPSTKKIGKRQPCDTDKYLPAVKFVYGFDHPAAMAYNTKFMASIKSDEPIKSAEYFMCFVLEAHFRGGFMDLVGVPESDHTRFLDAWYALFYADVKESPLYSWLVVFKTFPGVFTAAKNLKPEAARNLIRSENFGKANVNPKYVQRADHQKTVKGDLYGFIGGHIVGPEFSHSPPRIPKQTSIHFPARLMNGVVSLPSKLLEKAVAVRTWMGFIAGYFMVAVNILNLRGDSNMTKMRSGNDAASLHEAVFLTLMLEYRISNPTYTLILISTTPMADFLGHVSRNINSAKQFYIRDIAELEAIGVFNAAGELVNVHIVATRMIHLSSFSGQNTEDGVGKLCALASVLGSDGLNGMVVGYYGKSEDGRGSVGHSMIATPGSEVMDRVRIQARKMQDANSLCLKDHLIDVDKAKNELPLRVIENIVQWDSKTLPPHSSLHNKYRAPHVIVGNLFKTMVELAQKNQQVPLEIALALNSLRDIYGRHNKEVSPRKPSTKSDSAAKAATVDAFKRFTPSKIDFDLKTLPPHSKKNKESMLQIQCQLLGGVGVEPNPVDGSVTCSLAIVGTGIVLSVELESNEHCGHFEKQSTGQFENRTFELRAAPSAKSVSSPAHQFKIHPCRRDHLPSQGILNPEKQEPTAISVPPPAPPPPPPSTSSTPPSPSAHSSTSASSNNRFSPLIDESSHMDEKEEEDEDVKMLEVGDDAEIASADYFVKLYDNAMPKLEEVKTGLKTKPNVINGIQTKNAVFAVDTTPEVRASTLALQEGLDMVKKTMRSILDKEIPFGSESMSSQIRNLTTLFDARFRFSQFDASRGLTYKDLKGLSWCAEDIQLFVDTTRHGIQSNPLLSLIHECHELRSITADKSGIWGAVFFQIVTLDPNNEQGHIVCIRIKETGVDKVNKVTKLINQGAPYMVVEDQDGLEFWTLALYWNGVIPDSDVQDVTEFLLKRVFEIGFPDHTDPLHAKILEIQAAVGKPVHVPGSGLPDYAAKLWEYHCQLEADLKEEEGGPPVPLPSTVLHIYPSEIYNTMLGAGIPDIFNPYKLENGVVNRKDEKNKKTKALLIQLEAELDALGDEAARKLHELMWNPSDPANTKVKSHSIDLVIVAIAADSSIHILNHSLGSLTYAQKVVSLATLTRPTGRQPSTGMPLFAYHNGSSFSESFLPAPYQVEWRKKSDLSLWDVATVLASWCTNHGLSDSNSVTLRNKQLLYDGSLANLLGSVAVGAHGYKFSKTANRGVDRSGKKKGGKKTEEGGGDDGVEDPEEGGDGKGVQSEQGGKKKKDKNKPYFVGGKTNAEMQAIHDFVGFAYSLDNLFSKEVGLVGIVSRGVSNNNSQLFQGCSKDIKSNVASFKANVLLKDDKKNINIAIVNFSSEFWKDGVVTKHLPAQPLHFPVDKLFYAFHGNTAKATLKAALTDPKGNRYFATTKETTARAHQFSNDDKKRPKLQVTSVCVLLGLRGANGKNVNVNVFFDVKETTPVCIINDYTIMLDDKKCPRADRRKMNLTLGGTTGFFTADGSSFHTPLKRKKDDFDHPDAPRVNNDGTPWTKPMARWEPKQSQRAKRRAAKMEESQRRADKTKEAKRDDAMNIDLAPTAADAAPPPPTPPNDPRDLNPKFQPFYFREGQAGENLRRHEPFLKKHTMVQVRNTNSTVEFNVESLYSVGGDLGDGTTIVGGFRNGDRIKTRSNEEIPRREELKSDIRSAWDRGVNAHDDIVDLNAELLRLKEDEAEKRLKRDRWMKAHGLDSDVGLVGQAVEMRLQIKEAEDAVAECKGRLTLREAAVRPEVNAARKAEQFRNRRRLEAERKARHVAAGGDGGRARLGKFVARSYSEELEHQDAKIAKHVAVMHKVIEILATCCHALLLPKYFATGRWAVLSYGRLYDKIKWINFWRGGFLTFVNEDHTSGTCSRCGCYSPPGWSREFHCSNFLCRYKDGRDENAQRGIYLTSLTRGAEVTNIIYDQLNVHPRAGLSLANTRTPSQ
ncbi:hypothetical protein HDU98_007583 [Podochytrium sp. JEL0797]|nr:hypothetical protein HDU98_007583 [Podochytrium sp. JEL0797]